MIGEIWEGPVFKLLAKNDSGAAAGHQSGVVIPKDLAFFFPQLDETKAQDDERIWAHLVVDGVVVDSVLTRYQFQTWGGTRKPERRVTDRLQPLLRPTLPGDVFLVYRSATTAGMYKFEVVTAGSPSRLALIASLGGRRWGSAPTSLILSSPAEERAELAILDAQTALPFQCFDADVGRTLAQRVARSRAFSKIVLASYPGCALCHGGLVNGARSELEAAHIVSRGRGGTDDPRNGLGLCRTHHWALDEGLWTVDATGGVIVSEAANRPRNASLLAVAGRTLRLSARPEHAPHPDAWMWHAAEVYVR